MQVKQTSGLDYEQTEHPALQATQVPLTLEKPGLQVEHNPVKHVWQFEGQTEQTPEASKNPFLHFKQT